MLWRSRSAAPVSSPHLDGPLDAANLSEILPSANPLRAPPLARGSADLDPSCSHGLVAARGHDVTARPDGGALTLRRRNPGAHLPVARRARMRVSANTHECPRSEFSHPDPIRRSARLRPLPLGRRLRSRPVTSRSCSDARAALSEVRASAPRKLGAPAVAPDGDGAVRRAPTSRRARTKAHTCARPAAGERHDRAECN